MKKNLSNKIAKVLSKENIELSYDVFKQKIYVNDIQMSDKNIKLQPWFSKIKVNINDYNDNNVYILLVECAQTKSFNSEEQKQAKKEQEKLAKEQEKLAKEQEKLAKKEQEKLAKKEQERLAKEQKKTILEAKINNFIEKFDYNILENIPKSTYINVIKLSLDEAGLPIKPIIYNRIITKYTLKKTIEQKQKYEEIGYILNDDGKPDSNIPANYEVFFDNYFLTTEQWKSIEDKESIKDNGYCYYDEWSGKYTLFYNNKFVDATPERFRTIVRQNSPLNNVYIVNDMYQDWIYYNRKGNYLVDYICGLKWDGKDRLGLNKDNNGINDNNNIVLEVLNAEQSLVNKKMINYTMLHACRQILWPIRYNFQHVLAFVGDTNCGKTKTCQDLFTFPCGIYYCEGVDITGPAWTWGARLMQVVANIWNEKKGINTAANETFKNFIDIINSQIVYQPKNKNEFVNEPSHNVCFITHNPGQTKLLADYSVSYEKRYFIIECLQNEQTFKNKYLHTIEIEREQIWAQLYEWCINNEDEINELNENEVNELKTIQERHKGITKESVYQKIDYLLNKKEYDRAYVVDIDEIRQSNKKNLYGSQRYNLERIYIGAFEELLKDNGFDSRHRSFVNNEDMKNIGWERKVASIDGKTYNCWVKFNNSDMSFRFNS